MKEYREWNDLKIINDKNNPFCTLYEYDDGSRFYIEPMYYSYLQGVFIHYPNRKDDILKEMEIIVKKNKLVIFSGMDEEIDEDPVTKTENAIVLTIYDVLDRLQIFIDNKSRGSDYGD